MAPIPVYANSPITAAKPDGVTPKTASAEDALSKTNQASSSSTTSNYTPSTYAAPLPGAVPSLPKPTSTATSQPYSAVQPTPTMSIGSASPAPPQPGSVPVSSLPPPPKAGEKYQPPICTPAPMTTMRVPHQMTIPAPIALQPSQYRGTSTATMALPSSHSSQASPGPTIIGGNSAQDLSHPMGYQQNTNASAERGALDDGGNGIWDAAKKLAQQTGERLAAVETEVWKKINKE